MSDKEVDLFKFEGRYGQTDLAFKIGDGSAQLTYTGPMKDQDDQKEATIWKLPIKMTMNEYVIVFNSNE